jgi:hypothetical protein
MLSSINCGCWSGNTCANVHDTSDQSDALGTRSAIWLIATLTFASGLVVALSHARDGKVSVGPYNGVYQATDQKVSVNEGEASFVVGYLF